MRCTRSTTTLSGASLNDYLTEARALLERGHQLFAGPLVDAEGGVSAGPAGLSSRADQIAQFTAGSGVPAGVVRRSGVATAGLHRLAATDESLTSAVSAARDDHHQVRSASRVILDAAHADSVPAGDTPMGRREAVGRMTARLRAQHGHIARSRGQAAVLAARMRRLRYLRAAAGRGQADAGSTGGSGRGAVLSAIRRALDIKGIRNPVARARWERGMDLVAKRESGYNAGATNGTDINAQRGTASKGAFQFIGPTFAAYHEPGTSPNINNLVAQACAFINYARGRYGVAWDASNLTGQIQQADPRRGPKGY